MRFVSLWLKQIKYALLEKKETAVLSKIHTGYSNRDYKLLQPVVFFLMRQSFLF